MILKILNEIDKNEEKNKELKQKLSNMIENIFLKELEDEEDGLLFELDIRGIWLIIHIGYLQKDMISINSFLLEELLKIGFFTIKPKKDNNLIYYEIMFDIRQLNEWDEING